LKRQLKDGGRLIVPVGEYVQELIIVTRRGAAFEERNVLAVQFVPMTGEIRKD
jgi:protein-L-isoaspartate(D-aspartate) O-methyltransferase